MIERAARDAGRRDTRKKDAAPRGIFRHRSGVWAALHAVLATFIKSGWGRSSLTLCVSTMTVELESRTNPAGALSRSARRNALKREQRRPAV